MTDSKRAADCIKVKIRRLSSYSHLWISYNEESKSLINADTGATIAQIRSYDDGRAFEGFGSGKAYISFEAKGVKKDIVFTLKKSGVQRDYHRFKRLRFARIFGKSGI